MHEYVELVDLAQLGQTAKLKLVPLTKDFLTITQAVERIKQLSYDLQNAGQAITQQKNALEDHVLTGQESVLNFTVKRYELNPESYRLNSRCWDPFVELDVPWEKVDGKFFSRCILPQHKLETGVHSLFYQTVSPDLKITRTVY